jgi:uncharacterized protein (TIGR02217 family)
MAFHDVSFPANLSFGSIGGPERRTEIVTLANGHEERNTPWADSLRRYDAGLGMRSLDDVAVLTAFFEARAGQLHAFRWKDWADHKSSLPSDAPAASDQQLGIGDGTRTTFRLQKRYASGPYGYDRAITKPVEGTVIVAIDGDTVTAWSCDHDRGTVTFDAPPANGAMVTAGFEFDVPVRFDVDRIAISVDSFEAGQVPDVPVVEVRT